MAKFNVRAFHVKAPLDLTKLNEDAVFTPCSNGQEMSVGLIAAGPAQDKLTWNASGMQFLEYAVQERRVPKKWLDAEMRRRSLPGHTIEQLSQLRETINAELWQKILPVNKYGWVCYVPDENLLLVSGSVRHAEYVTAVVRHAVGSLPVDNAFGAHAFSLAVHAFIQGDQETDDICLGRNVNLYQGSGRDKSVVAFKNYDSLQDNDHITEHLKQCREVASAGFVLDGVEEGSDDVVASPYAELTITEVKDKEADEYGTMICRANRARYIVRVLRNVLGYYTKETGEKV